MPTNSNYKCHPCAVSEILGECKRSVSALPQAQHIQLEFQIDRQLPDFLLLDSNRVKQVINILTTIYLRIAEFGKAKVNCERTSNKGRALIRFACVFQSLPNFDLNELYKPFVAPKSNMPDVHIPNWLRLRLAYRLVEFMNGHTFTNSSADNSFVAGFDLPLHNTAVSSEPG